MVKTLFVSQMVQALESTATCVLLKKKMQRLWMTCIATDKGSLDIFQTASSMA